MAAPVCRSKAGQAQGCSPLKKLVVATAALTLSLGACLLTGCGAAQDKKTAEAAADTAAPSSAMVADAPASAPAPAALRSIAPEAPAFAVYMPGSEPDAEPTLALGPAGPGGMVEFSSPASPEAVIAFYRQRAEEGGLSTVATMNRDGTLSYTASDGLSGQGQLLNVVASPAGESRSRVHLDWSAGH